jgi:hypothetical protein
METVTGQVDAVRKDGKGLCIDDVWYSSWDGLQVSKGDTVVFNYVKKGQYNNIKGKVRVSSGGPAPSSSAPAKKDFNLGVEMGHASNLAMRMMEQTLMHSFPPEQEQALEVGSDEYFRKFMEYTDNIYEIMKRMKDRKAKANQQEEEEKSEVETSVSSEDIFG